MSEWRQDIVEEFRSAPVGDERLRQRLMTLAGSMADHPDKSFPQVLTSAELEGAYRFLGNAKVEPDGITEPHICRTIARLEEQELVLVAHDSSFISFNSDGGREGLTEARGHKQGFLAHCSLALRADGSRRPEGVVAASYHVPRKTPDGALQDRWVDHVHRVHQRGLAPDQVIHLMDREADDYEILDLFKSIGGRFVIRVQHNRRLQEGLLREVLKATPVYAEREVPLSRRNGKAGPKQKRIHPPRQSRMARLAVSASTVEISRTPRSSGSETLSLNVVRVWEPDAPAGETPVEWLLYTSEPIETAEQVLRVVDWYRARWTIEEYFKALKTGCAVERRQLRDFYALTNAVALFIPIAWKLLLLKSEVRTRPFAEATTVLSDDELEVLRVVARKPLAERPTVSDVVLAVAALGGHLKHNGLPGWQTLARGYTTLRNLVEGWNLRRSVEAGTCL